MRILVCGGRDFDNFFLVDQILDEYLEQRPHIIQGGAKGADTNAKDYAEMNNLVCTTYPALWNKYKNAAGPIRNQQMLDEGKPDLVVAFPGGKGTADMVKRARKAGVPVREIQYDKT